MSRSPLRGQPKGCCTIDMTSPEDSLLASAVASGLSTSMKTLLGWLAVRPWGCFKFRNPIVGITAPGVRRVKGSNGAGVSANQPVGWTTSRVYTLTVLPGDLVRRTAAIGDLCEATSAQDNSTVCSTVLVNGSAGAQGQMCLCSWLHKSPGMLLCARGIAAPSKSCYDDEYGHTCKGPRAATNTC